MSNTETTSSKLPEQLSLKDFFLNYLLIGVGLGVTGVGLFTAAYWLVNPVTNPLSPFSYIVIGLSMVVSWKLLKPMRDGVSKPDPDAT